MKISKKNKQIMEGSLLNIHSNCLLSTLTLAHDRSLKLENTINSAELSGALMDGDNLRSIQLKTIEEIGGVKTSMLFDVGYQIHKYHHAPLQISYCLLYAMLEKYKYLILNYPLFRDEKIDKYFQENEEYIELLKKLRDSILHERPDNVNEQKKFLIQFNDFTDSDKKGSLLLIEGHKLFSNLLMRVWSEIENGQE